MRFLCLVKSRECSAAPPQALMDAMGALIEDASKAGVLVETGGLLPTAMGLRVRVEGGAITILDGPFAEAREVVGGYAVFETETRAEIRAWTKRFIELHRDHWPEWVGESEVRQIMEMPGAC